MREEIFQVDAFTDKPFGGNPAAVVPLDAFPDDRRMQSIAAEMNLAETAFVVPEGDAFHLRWFTPTVEVDLCGHATLAAAHILWETGRLAAETPATFQSKSGPLIARPADGNAIALDFPALPATSSPPPAELLESIDFQPVFIGNSRFDYLVEADSAETVRNARIDFVTLKKLNTRGLIITAASDDPSYDFISRFFAPGCGIDEDPVTGSAHSVLGPYWQQKTGKSVLRAYQASPRGGSMRVEVHGDRTHLIGRAITVLRGQLLV